MPPGRPPAAPPRPILSAGEIANALARISRAIRLTLALEARTDEALRALRAGVVAERIEARRRAEAEASARREARSETVERLVFEAAEREIEDLDVLNGVLEAIEERLDHDEAYQDLERLPLRETVERLCADLQLTPGLEPLGRRGLDVAALLPSEASTWRRPSRKPLGRLKAPADLAQVPGPVPHRLE